MESLREYYETGDKKSEVILLTTTRGVGLSESVSSGDHNELEFLERGAGKLRRGCQQQRARQRRWPQVRLRAFVSCRWPTGVVKLEKERREDVCLCSHEEVERWSLYVTGCSLDLKNGVSVKP